jgi:hypothetical protein
LYKDELKETTDDPDSTVRKIVNEAIDESEKIGKLQDCLKNKDRRLKKIEERWSLLIQGLAGGLLVLLGILWFYTVIHVLNMIPWPVSSIVDGDTMTVMVSDWWLLLGECGMTILSFVGLYALVWLGHAIYIEETKKED